MSFLKGLLGKNKSKPQVEELPKARGVADAVSDEQVAETRRRMEEEVRVSQEKRRAVQGSGSSDSQA